MYMIKKVKWKLQQRILVMLLTILAVTPSAWAESLTGLSDTNIVGTYSVSGASWGRGSGTYTADGTMITGTAEGYNNTFGSAKTVTTTLTLKNNSGNPAKLSFDYVLAVKGTGTLTVNGTASVSGRFSQDIAAGASINIVLTASGNGSSAVATLTDVQLVQTKNVSLRFLQPVNGSYTVDGSAIQTDTTKSMVSTTEVELIATPATGYKFLGWYNETQKSFFSSTLSCKKNFADSYEISAKFISTTTPVFDVAGQRFTDLNLAHTYAVNNNYTTIILASDGILPAGEYTIAQGKTLLIPCDATNACYTTVPGLKTPYQDVSAFRTLTMADGAKIVVNGEMSVSGCVDENIGSNASPSGPQGFVVMHAGSNITVNRGGKLYAWGYIVGKFRKTIETAASEGTVVINSGATVYENFQITDWRGGTDTIPMTKDDGDNLKNGYRVLPVSQYYIQNVQVPMTLCAGAKEVGVVSVGVSYKLDIMHRQPEVAFFGADSLFNATSGYIIKDYDETTDRIVFDVYGDFDVASTTITVEGIKVVVTVVEDVTLVFSKYVVGINSAIKLHIHEGTANLGMDLALLPGVDITVDDDAAIKLAEGCSLTIYDSEQWGGYVGSTNQYIVPLKYAYNRLADRSVTSANALPDAKITINGTADFSEGVVYTTESGANICSTGNGKVITAGESGAVNYQLRQNVNGTADEVYDEITVIPAKLKNADGSYIQSGTNTYVYDSTAGKWICEDEHDWESNSAGKICSVCGDSYIILEGNEERFSLSMTKWYMEEYDEGSSWAGFEAKLTGSETAKELLSKVGFQISTCENELWDNWSKAVENTGIKEDAYIFRCLVELPEGTSSISARAMVMFDVEGNHESAEDDMYYASNTVTLDLTGTIVKEARAAAETEETQE